MGGIRQWSVWVTDNGDGTATLTTESGLQGGQLIVTDTPITKGLNIGKKNETTAYQQAVKDATTELNKKVKKGYVSDITQIKAKVDTATTRLKKQQKP